MFWELIKFYIWYIITGVFTIIAATAIIMTTLIAVDKKLLAAKKAGFDNGLAASKLCTPPKGNYIAELSWETNGDLVCVVRRREQRLHIPFHEIPEIRRPATGKSHKS